MGNAVRHGRHSDSNTRKMVEKMHQGLFASPDQATKQSAKDGSKKQGGARSGDKSTGQMKKKGNTNQREDTVKAAGSSAKKRRKKKTRPTSTEPRKGRKESFTKYMPNYVPTVPIDDTLGGVYDAVEHEDPHHGYYDGKTFTPIDETLAALCDVVEDEQLDTSTQHLRGVRPTTALPIKMPARSTQNPIRAQTYQERRYCSDATSVHTNDRYYGTYDNIYYYDNPDTVQNHHHDHHHGDNCAGDNYHNSDYNNDCNGNNYYADGAPGNDDNNTGACDSGGDNPGGGYDTGPSYDAGGSYDSGASYDAGGSYDSGPSYDAGGSYDVGGGYDTGGGYDGGGSSSCD
ncbi:putative cdc2-related protein kinase 1 [Phytophthora cinnamomi]|uniref:putative cdc2-related protein kinase 1 n=1 Tax=Phytophthora cinnamomi TaxID=4785 RepID=UPI00355987C5|nr:putative cdc2-related protein kinase 1 [Phytophthora cinnamomi]